MIDDVGIWGFNERVCRTLGGWVIWRDEIRINCVNFTRFVVVESKCR